MPEDDIEGRIRAFWDRDSDTYDRSPSHGASDAVEAAVWRAVLWRHLPPVPARVLDAGAGTGAMSLLAAELGHLVTALDLSAGMLERLRAKAAARGMQVEIVHGPAHEPPPGPFDAVIERHLLWTVPEPGAALSAWHRAAPEGRLILFEGIMPGREHVRRARGWAAERVRRAAGVPHDHHAEYDPDILDLLPLARLSSPGPLIHEVSAAGWGRVRLERLRDIEWARGMAGAEGVAQRLQGWQQYVLVAEA
jgi:SAM-dependent methyltransferase